MSEKQRVGILTYHRHYNYGTMLQAIALQKAIENMGASAEIIDFYESNVMQEEEKRKLYKSRRVFYLLHFSKYAQKAVKQAFIRTIMKCNQKNTDLKKKAFDEFYGKHAVLSANQYHHSEELRKAPPDYDVYMVGSDQTWNPNVGGNPDAFYLDFAPDGRKRVSYAPSVSVSVLTDAQRERMARMLKNVDELSCREETGSAMLSEITQRQVVSVLDPTFLLDHSEWDRFAGKIEHPRRYILQYLLGNNFEHRNYIKRISRQTGLPIVSIPCVPFDMVDASTMHAWCGPDGFLSLIRDAELVCTDSFHGTAFSINYRRPVLSFMKMSNRDSKSENSRLANIYEVFDLPQRIVTDFRSEISPELTSFDYSPYNEKIEQRINASQEYLKHILG